MRCARRKLPSAARRFTVSECDGTLGVRDDRVQHRALVMLRKLPELRARRPRFLDLAGGEGDLDVGRKQRRSLERFRHLGTRPSDRGERRLVPPLRKAELGETRLRLPAAPARFVIGLLGCVELTS